MKLLRLSAFCLGVIGALIWSLGGIGFAQEEEGPPPPLEMPSRGIGLAVSFPLPLLPAGPPAASTATVFLDLIAQGQVSSEVLHRVELRLFFSTTGFRTDLTSLRESLLITFTPSPAVFYIGGGWGIFPVEFVAAGSAGFLFATFLRTGVEVQVFPIGLFLDVSYGVMPQPFLDVQTPAPNATLVPSVLELSVGALIHF